MISYTTTADLERMRGEVAPDVLRQRATRARERTPDGTTFLSHSSKDDHLMPIVVHILENHGATVYLDDKDPHLLAKPGREIAEILRSRVRHCRKFVLFATRNILGSKWVPWELGLADGHKHSKNTAIFPSVDTAHDTTWTTQEYLGAYDRIVWGDLEGHSYKLWMVLNQDANTATPLRDWLAR